ncbi:VOC family protein [Mesonia sp.]|uniref:VOC family protein n=1 Tax=Mesonia sp. TaxID=1960830 RepID=UPI003F9D05C5
MQSITRMMTNICSDNLQKSKEFYTRLFDLNVDFDSEWYVHLSSQDSKFELGIIDRSHDVVPKEFQQHPQGFYITFVVDNVDHLFTSIKENEIEVISEPKNTSYGQRRCLLKDPDGTLIDISSPIEGFKI